MNALEPIFQPIFGQSWRHLPPVLQDHYAVRPAKDDIVRAEGWLDIHIHPLFGLFARLSGILAPFPGRKVPTHVTFSFDGLGMRLSRSFHYPERGEHHFASTMVPAGGQQLVELMRFGLGWKHTYSFDGEKIVLSHQGYVWRLFGRNVPIPLELLIGRGYAEEWALSGSRFAMKTYTTHRLFGRLFGYAGEFDIVEVSCPERS